MTKDNSNYTIIENKLLTTRRKETYLLLLTGILKALAIISAILLFASVIELIARGNMMFRSSVATIILISGLILFAMFIMPNVIRWFGLKNLPDIEAMAMRVGSIYPDLKDRLSNALQLIIDLPNAMGTSKQLTEAAFADIAKVADNKDFDAVIDK